MDCEKEVVGRFKIMGYKFLSPNQKKHWAEEYKNNSLKNTIVKMYLNNLDLFENDEEPIDICMTRVAPKRFDEDNFIFSCKALRDCIADHLLPGLAPGRADGDEKLKFVYDQRKGSPGEYALEVKFLKQAKKGLSCH